MPSSFNFLRKVPRLMPRMSAARLWIAATVLVFLLLSSVPEMELGWLEKVLAHRRMAAAGN